MNTLQKVIAFTTLTTLSTFGLANAAQAGVSFRMNHGVAYGDNGDMGITSQVDNTATVDFNDLIPNKKGSKSSENFSTDFATYTFENGNKSSVIADKWGPENIDGSVNKDNPYLAVFSGDQVTIELTETASYFGMNWGSVSRNNKIEFYNGEQLVSTFQSAGDNPNEVVEGQEELNAVWQLINADGSHQATNFWNEADAYLEFWANDVSSLFDRIVMTQVSRKGGGFETDNHSFLLSDKPFDPEAVPEPGMVVGLLAVGGLIVKKVGRKS
ncbi:MAG: PEP-CTERM sorting domain-containing protein [Cyanobacteriota bacterium]|nr:PEP-CTERM sorting domain-containing protein [Cyanobacteriota bacterium]